MWVGLLPVCPGGGTSMFAYMPVVCVGAYKAETAGNSAAGQVPTQGLVPAPLTQQQSRHDGGVFGMGGGGGGCLAPAVVRAQWADWRLIFIQAEYTRGL